MITTAAAILPQATGQAQLTEAAPQQPSSEKPSAAPAKWNAPVLTKKVRLAAPPHVIAHVMDALCTPVASAVAVVAAAEDQAVAATVADAVGAEPAPNQNLAVKSIIFATTTMITIIMLILVIQTLMMGSLKRVSNMTGSHPLGSSALGAPSMEVAVPSAASCLEHAHPDSLCRGSRHRRQEGCRALPSTCRLP